jgi:hypothetical protein
LDLHQIREGVSMGRMNQPVVEFLHKADNVVGGVDGGLKTVRAIAASEAFRKYNWLTHLPGTNAAGDLRGMVISGKWRTVFSVSSNVSEAVGQVAIVVSFAANLAEAWSRMNAIYRSSNSWDTKASMLSSQASSIAIRTVGGIIPFGASLLFLSAKGYCQLGGLDPGAAQSAWQCVQSLDAANAWVSSTFKKVTNGDNIYLYIKTNLVIH